MRRYGWVLVLVGLVGAAAAWLAWTGREEAAPPEEAEPLAEDVDVDEAAEDDPFGLFAELADAAVPPGAPGEEGWGRERWRGGSEEERQARRERFRANRERFRNMSPEERREWMRRRVSITALGAAEPRLEPEDVMDALRATRPQMRECMQAQGGFRAFREAMRSASSSPDGGARRRGLMVSFDVSPTGAPSPESIVIEPAPPEPFYECFANAIAQADLPPPEAEARVEMRMGAGGGRGGRGGGDRQRPEPGAGTP